MTDDTTNGGETADENRSDGGTPSKRATRASAAQTERTRTRGDGTENAHSGDTAGTPDDVATQAGGRGDVVYTTSPILTPVLGIAGAVLLVGAAVVAVLVSAPDIVGGTTIAELLLNAIVVLLAVVLLRLGVTLLVLRRTTYTLRTDGFEKVYELAYRRNERRIPITQLRGQEFNRSRFQSLFDCATVRLLTGGTNRSLGFVEFEHVPEHETVQRRIRDLRRRHEHQDRGDAS